MQLDFDADSVTMRLTRAEAVRLGVAVNAGWDTVSRAEYFTRTGLSQPAMSQIVQALTTTPDSPSGSLALPLEPGDEIIENPRRPRPPR